MIRIEAGLMARVQAVLDARRNQPRAAVDGRPKLQVTTGLEARTEDGGGTYAELMIYDEISWFGITAQDVADALDGITGDLTVRINSPGGDVYDGIAIYNMLADYPGHVTVSVDGLAASAASIIAMSGDTIRMNRASQMMIHDASTMVYGDAALMTEAAALLDRISDTIAGVYADRTGTEPDAWRTRMRAETWYNATEAVAVGLATKMAPSRRDPGDGEESGDAAAVAASWDLTVFQFAGRSAAPAPPTNSAEPAAPADPPADVDPVEPLAPEPDPAAADPAPEPIPTPVDPAPDPVPDPVAPAVPDDWAATTEHLTTTGDPDEEFATLREALL